VRTPVHCPGKLSPGALPFVSLFSCNPSFRDPPVVGHLVPVAPASLSAPVSKSQEATAQGSAAIETINRSVDSAGSAPSPMPFKKPGAVMADVWSMPDAEVKPTPPPSRAPTPPASLHGDAANAVKPVAMPSRRIKMAAVEATVAAAAPPVPPATNNGFSDDFYTACNENVAEARYMAIKAAKQAGYFTAQAAAYRAEKLGSVDRACEHDAHVADATA